jgi:hypothetical protein
MRLMAVAAGDSGREHLALLERAVVVDFVQHLPVDMVEPAGERRDPMRVRQPSPRDPLLRERAPACVTEPAGFHFLAQRGRRKGVGRVPCAGINRRDAIAPLVEANQQPLVRVFRLA